MLLVLWSIAPSYVCVGCRCLWVSKDLCKWTQTRHQSWSYTVSHTCFSVAIFMYLHGKIRSLKKVVVLNKKQSSLVYSGPGLKVFKLVFPDYWTLTAISDGLLRLIINILQVAVNVNFNIYSKLHFHFHLPLNTTLGICCMCICMWTVKHQTAQCNKKIRE